MAGWPPPHNQTLQWTGPAEWSLSFESMVGAGPAIERWSVMQQKQTSSPSAPPATPAWWHEVSKPARAAFVCGFPIAFGAAIWEAVQGDSLGPEHPLSITRLGLRLVPFFATAVCIAIGLTGTFRAWRATTRLRKGLCLTCGYDLRAHRRGDRCPECGSPLARPAARPAA